MALERSNRLRPVALVTYNLALAYRGLGRYVTAVEEFERYLRAPEPTAAPERLAAIREELAELRTRLVRVTVGTIAPPGATLVVDAHPVTVTAAETLTLDPGAHVFEWSAPDHRTERMEIPGAAGSITALNVRLEPLREGRLVIEPLPATASVTVDGRPLGASRQELVMPPGEHWVELRAPGFIPARRAVRVGPTGVVRLAVSLDRTPRPGWVLPLVIAGGVAAVGVTIGVALALRPEVPPPRTGTWDNVQEPSR